ncbi:MAG: chloramphenicol acetyltransferase, partial [Lachnospiraceae bacterium]|nr:chloramphenicol acetyltransferase [Lachnospiraceae bacterium]
SFGKYFAAPNDPNKILMPVSSQTHHGLMDGVHVGKFYIQLQEACDRL